MTLFAPEEFFWRQIGVHRKILLRNSTFLHYSTGTAFWRTQLTALAIDKECILGGSKRGREEEIKAACFFVLNLGRGSSHIRLEHE